MSRWTARSTLESSATSHGQQDVDDRMISDHAGQRGRLSVDEDIDVLAEDRARIAQSIAHPRPARVEPLEKLADRPSLDLDAQVRSREERDE